MNFGGAKADTLGPNDPDVPSRPSAAPPPCPRCELVKSQCTKTIINYQRSHRKKIEALRSELKCARQQVDSLQGQLQGYKTTARVVPVVGVLAAASWLLVKRVFRPKDSTGAVPTSDPAQQQQQHPGVASPAQEETAVI